MVQFTGTEMPRMFIVYGPCRTMGRRAGVYSLAASEVVDMCRSGTLGAICKCAVRVLEAGGEGGCRLDVRAVYSGAGLLLGHSCLGVPLGMSLEQWQEALVNVVLVGSVHLALVGGVTVQDLSCPASP